MKNKLLLIGPLPPPMGGDTEHFSFLTNRLKENESLKFGVFNTSRGNNNPSFMQNLKVLFRLVTYLIWNVKHYDKEGKVTETCVNGEWEMDKSIKSTKKL